jgi:hypothetical protein
MHHDEFERQDSPFERVEDGAVLRISNVLRQASPQGLSEREAFARVGGLVDRGTK